MYFISMPGKIAGFACCYWEVRAMGGKSDVLRRLFKSDIPSARSKFGKMKA
jgi:hypothetical protein